MTGITGENGEAHFDQEAGVYTVHVLQTPEGYQQNTEEYPAPREPGNVEIVLEKEPSL